MIKSNLVDYRQPDLITPAGGIVYGDELPFTGIGSAILTASAVVVTVVGAVLAFAAGPVAAFLGGAAAVATRFVNRSGENDG